MTIIVQHKGVFYTDSRRTSRTSVTCDTVDKIISLDANSKRLWKGEPILGLAAAGPTKDIDLMIKVLTDGGEEGYDAVRLASGLGAVRKLDCTVGILTATKYWLLDINGARPTSKLPIAIKRDRNEITAFGSGKTASRIAETWFDSDGVGQVCGAIAMAKGTCGGFVLTLDTNERRPTITSRHYRYPLLRMLLGGFYSKWNRLVEWYKVGRYV